MCVCVKAPPKEGRSIRLSSPFLRCFVSAKAAIVVVVSRRHLHTPTQKLRAARTHSHIRELSFFFGNRWII